MSDYLKRCQIEDAENWKAYVNKLPFIKFPGDWEVQVIPPFCGALARFRVKLPSGTKKSIYFDAYDRLGYYGQPYWEVYPFQGDVGRCDMNDVEELLIMIADEQDSTP